MTDTIDTHIVDAVGRPDLIWLDDRLVCVRFETMKVLSADAAIRRLLDTGRIARGDTVVDSSSGIYAYALALACHRYGLHCHIVGSTTVDDAARLQLELLGATLERMPPSNDLKLDQSRRVARIRELLAEDPRPHWMRQYHDDVHYLGYRPVAQPRSRRSNTSWANDSRCWGRQNRWPLPIETVRSCPAQS